MFTKNQYDHNLEICMIRFDFCYDFNSIKAKNAMTAKREIDYIIAKKWEFNLGKDMTLIWDATLFFCLSSLNCQASAPVPNWDYHHRSTARPF